MLVNSGLFSLEKCAVAISSELIREVRHRVRRD